MSAAIIAKAIGVNRRTPKAYAITGRAWKAFREQHELRSWDADELTHLKAVLGACSGRLISRPGFGAVANAAAGVLRSINSGRICPVVGWKLSERTPWELCELVARIAADCDGLNRTTAAVDQWLRDHREELIA